jgi:uncharacterized protein (TIGR02284 family)
MEEVSKVIFALNNLIEINDQRSTLYNGLAEKAKEVELKLVYLQYAIQAQTFTATLNKWRHAYGATSNVTKKSSVLDSVMGQMRKAFVIGGKDGDLKQCESLESNALKIYKEAVALSFLPSAAIEDIEKQTSELEKTHTTLHSFRQGGPGQWQIAFS